MVRPSTALGMTRGGCSLDFSRCGRVAGAEKGVRQRGVSTCTSHLEARNSLPETRSHDHADTRSFIAVARAHEHAAAERAAKLERRVAELENELQHVHNEVLELNGVFSRHSRFDATAYRHMPDAQATRRIFADVQARKLDVPSQVTVVIPAYGKITHTLRALRSIALSWSFTLNPTIIVVDDASPDDSIHELMAIPGINVLRNLTTLGFLRASNRGVQLARTRYICFLSSDAEVKDGWLDTLYQTAESNGGIGAVGSKLVNSDKTLQEAGGIVWADGSHVNVGRGDDPFKSEYNFPRDVDYCSAASLLVRTEILRETGGFDERYAPTQYEDIDLCFEVAARGYRVVYEPRSIVVHYHEPSSDEINRPKFAEKWAPVLAKKFAPSAGNVPLAMYGTATKTVLIIDSYVPLHDRDAGSNRLFKIIQMMREMGYRVLFLPGNSAEVEPYSTDLARLGVETLYMREGFLDLEALLTSVLPRVDLAWICRPEWCERFLSIVRNGTSAPIIYDTVDLHFMREKLRSKLEEDRGDELWRKLQNSELAMARAADRVITVTDVERGQLQELGIDNVAVIPTIHDEENHRHFSYAVRSGLVFIGGYGHSPNVDAVVWLCREIMPLVWKELPRLSVTLLGNTPPEAVTALRSDLVAVTGFIENVAPYFEQARIFVAPLRYGAGMKGKVGHALSYGLPIVATTLATDGFDLVNGENCLIADDAESFARAIITLYRDEALWDRLSENGTASLRPFGREAVGERLRELFSDLGVTAE